MAEILAASRAGRPSGVAASRLNTPYWRSNPVAIPRLTMAVDITARARIPGARKVTASVTPAGFGSTSTREKKTSSPTGCPASAAPTRPGGASSSPRPGFGPASPHGRVPVARRLGGASPPAAEATLRRRRPPSTRIHRLTVPFAAADRAVTACSAGPVTGAAWGRPGWRPRRLAATRLGHGTGTGDRRQPARRAGQAEEHVLEALAAGSQVRQGQVSIGQPGGQGGDRGRGGLGVQPGTRRAAPPPRSPESRTQGDGVHTWRVRRSGSLVLRPWSSARPGVPLATIWPWSMMTIRSARRSASSTSRGS